MINLFQHPKRVLAVIVAISVILRVMMAIYLGNQVVTIPGATDQLSYNHLGLRLLDGHGFSFGQPWWPMTQANEPTAHWSFLYSYFIAGIYGVSGRSPLVARLFQAVLVGLLQPYLAYLIGRRLFDEWAGLAAAALTAVYIYFVYYAGTIMTEPIYIVTIMASLYWTIKMADTEQKNQPQNAVILGLLLGITVLLRQVFLLIIPFIILWLVWARYRRQGRVPLAEVILAGIIVVAMILPFTYYNYTRFDRFVLLNTNAGYAFYLGNHPIYGTRFIPILPDYGELIPDDVPIDELDEAALDQVLLGKGIQFVIDEPGRYLLLSASRIPVYFMFWPSANSGILSNISRLGSFGLLLPFMLYGLVLAIHRNWSKQFLTQPLFLILLFSLVYTAIHILTWALIRYRLPVDAFLVIFAGLAVVDLARRLVPGVARAFTVTPSS